MTRMAARRRVEDDELNAELRAALNVLLSTVAPDVPL